MTAHASPETDNGGNARCLDEALEDTFPASDPPSMTSPVAATPSSDVIAETTAPLRIFRVVAADQASEPFAPGADGGRWTPPGKPCVYASLSPACALLEYLAHLEGGEPAPSLMMAVATAPPGIALSECNEPSTWKERPYRPEVQRVGADWLEGGRSLALRVPSAVCDGETNLLLNPSHPGFAALQLQELRPLRIDPRLTRR
jgi:RES domain-containing protein